jgi:hypothetical protein
VPSSVGSAQLACSSIPSLVGPTTKQRQGNAGSARVTRTASVKQIVDKATGEAEAGRDHDESKDPAAVLLDERGGLEGGKASAEKLSARKRSQSLSKTYSTTPAMAAELADHVWTLNEIAGLLD